MEEKSSLEPKLSPSKEEEKIYSILLPFGRINRYSFLGQSFIILILLLVTSFIPPLAIITLPIAFYLAIITRIKRLHDFNCSGKWFLLEIVFIIIILFIQTIFKQAFISLCTTLSCIQWSVFALGISPFFPQLIYILMPGTNGENRFGLPRETPSYEETLGVFNIIAMALSIMAAIIISQQPDMPF